MIPSTQPPSHASGHASGHSPGRASANASPHYAQLLWTLVRTDFKSRYHASASGFLWALLKPLVMFLVLLGVFSFIFATQPNYRLNLIIGLFLWDFFNESTRVGLTSLHAKGFLLGKARLPAAVVVIASAANALLTMSVFAVIVTAFLYATGRAPGLAGLALFALYAGCLLLIAVGFSLATSILFLRWRDLNQIWEVVLQAGFFIAPIVYPLDILPERFHRLLYFWPPTPVIQFSRAVLVDHAIPSLRGHLYLLGGTAIILAAGAAIFRHFRPRAAELL